MFYRRELRWAEEAEALKPYLNHELFPAVDVVRVREESAAWQGWAVERAAAPEEIYGKELPRSWEYTFDFGRYCVGFPVLEFEFTKRVDAPFRLELKMAETPYELARDFNTYHGSLGRGWLQEALVVEDTAVPVIRLPRRYAFRYLKLKVECNSSYYKVILRNVRCDTVTAACCASVPPLPESADELVRRIDRIGLDTLAACMQECFEDGPKRDRRLWLGDLRLQALVNYRTFRNYGLVKRCLLMFAAAAREEDGIVPGCVYPAFPRPEAGNFLFDYSVLFGDMLLDYVNASGDEDCGRDLFPVAKRQSEAALREMADGCFHDFKRHWLFIDWKDELEKECAGHGVVVYSLIRTLALARRLGLEAEVADYPSLIARFQEAGRKKWFDPVRGYFIDNGQLSWAAQIWAANGEMLPAPEIRELLKRLLSAPDAVCPGGPFLYNQMILVLERYGLRDEALRLTRSYWGKMADSGADTFWEVFDPDDPMRSPYGDAVVNSHCHAWSTPVFCFRQC